MRLVAAVVAATALVLPAAQAAERMPPLRYVLGIESTGSGSRLAWIEALRLTTREGPAVDLGRAWGSWTYSPDGSTVAIETADTSSPERPDFRLRFVSVREMHVTGELDTGGDVESLVWPAPDRLLAISADAIDVVDPARPALVRTVALPGTTVDVEAVAGGVALLLAPPDAPGPAVLAVADAGGTLRTVPLDRIAIGGVGFEEREPSLAVDRANHRVFVVGVDQTIAVVNIDTLAVGYHGGGKTRTLAKVEGTIRQALWLGNGLLAISGRSATGSAVRPLGLRLVDTRTWKTRVVDRWVDEIERGSDSARFVASSVGAPWLRYVYDLRAKLRYRVRASANGGWLYLAGAYGYVCEKGRVTRIVSAGTGRTARVPKSAQTCPYLLSAQRLLTATRRAPRGALLAPIDSLSRTPA